MSLCLSGRDRLKKIPQGQCRYWTSIGSLYLGECATILYFSLWRSPIAFRQKPVASHQGCALAIAVEASRQSLAETSPVRGEFKQQPITHNK
ncbi:MAG: hypothetical protein J7647_26970 [Cyanobacteria bacterium SBLK]|nr:hypothetical protein [Cyanobacteria bacterium SBLK]